MMGDTILIIVGGLLILSLILAARNGTLGRLWQLVRGIVAAPDPSPPGRPLIFLSFSRHDLASAKPIVAALRARGFEVWANLDVVPFSPDYEAEIDTAIQQSAAVLVIDSPDSAASPDVRREIAQAQAANRPIVPLLLGEEPSNLLPHLRHIPIQEGFVDELTRTLGYPPAQERPPQPGGVVIGPGGSVVYTAGGGASVEPTAPNDEERPPRSGGIVIPHGGRVSPAPDTSTSDTPSEPQPLPEDARSEAQPAKEAAESERRQPHGTPIGGHVREPDGYRSKKEAGESEDDVLIIRDDIQDEPASEKPASPRRERDEAEPSVPAAPSPAASAQPKEDAALSAEPEPTPDREAAPPEPEEAAVEPAPLTSQAPIEFAAHYPREIKPGPDEWQPLLAYLYRETAADAVEADAKERLGPRPDVRVTRRPALSQIQAGALVIATPDVPGLEFNPPSAVVRFVKDWHRFEFEFRATDAPLDEAANGRITFMVEGLIVGDVPLSVYVSESAASAETQVTQAHPYRAIFCSYSHKDTAIVELVELAVRTLGDQYLRDATTLRSGEDWNDALMRMIDAADIFQLFWSENAAGSQFVEEEWRYALSLKASQTKDDHFLRPVRWVDPINPNPPDVLSRIEFFYEPRLLHWQQIEPGDPQPPVGLHPGGSGTD